MTHSPLVVSLCDRTGAAVRPLRAYYNDNSPEACAWLHQLITDGLITPGDVDERPIQDVRPDDVAGYDRVHFFAGVSGWEEALRLADWTGPVWTGSCPCQPFSSAGKQAGASDERHLWPEFKRLIEACRPPVVFGEQVASKMGKEWFADVRRDFELAGYAVAAADLCASSVGAPHIRQRIFFCAYAQDCKTSPTARIARPAELWD